MTRPRWRPSLQWRLLLLNLASAGLCLGIFTYISHFYKQAAFPQRIQQATDTHQIDKNGDSPTDVPIVLSLFRQVNNEGTLLGLFTTSIAVATLTYCFSRSLYRPLTDIERAVERFNSGDFSARAPSSNIPEIDHLCLTLNSAAARLQDVETRRQTLVGDLSHELGTPLTVLKGYLELAQDDKVKLSHELLVLLVDEANRMHRLLGDLQLLSKVEVGNLHLHLRSFNPTPMIEHLLHFFTAQGQAAQQTVEWQTAGQLPDLYADPDRFSQILANLVSNAIRYTPAGGQVTITNYLSNRYLWFSVSDTGIGMSPQEIPFVFDRFWRSQAAKTMKNDGSGLGLAITKRLVEMQGGKIKAECEVGKGCTFQFALPLA